MREAIVTPWFMDRNRHGSLFDRGAADSYYMRRFNPHYGGVGCDSGERVQVTDPEMVGEYRAGFEYNDECGNFKQYD